MKTSRIHSAFTLVELLTAIAVIALLAAILIPVIVSSRKSAARSTCLSNIRQVSAAVLQYTQDYDGTFPPPTQMTYNADLQVQSGGAIWFTLLAPYMKGEFPRCPLATLSKAKYQQIGFYCGYSLNSNLLEFVQIDKDAFAPIGKIENYVEIASNTVLISETRTAIAISSPEISDDSEHDADSPKGALRHDGGANYAFVDGHAKWFRPDAFADPCDGVKPCFRKP